MGAVTFSHANCIVDVSKSKDTIVITLTRGDKHTIICDELLDLDFLPWLDYSPHLVELDSVLKDFAKRKIGDYIFSLYEENFNLKERLFEYELADGDIAQC